jgi:hypothetical protein
VWIRGRGVDQGHRSIKRLGGGGRFRGAFWDEKGMHLKFFSRKCWQREGGGERKNNCNHIKCNLNNIFHEGKGRFTTREKAFFVFSEGQIIAIIKNAI